MATANRAFCNDGVLQIKSGCVITSAEQAYSSIVVDLPLGSGNILKTWMSTYRFRMGGFYK